MRYTAVERHALVAGMLGACLVPLNSTLIAVGLPDIGNDLSVAKGTTAILVTAYLIGMLVLQPFGGRVGDRFGVRRTIIGGLCGFALFSAAAAASPGFGALLGARLGQAVSGAALMPNVSALLRDVVGASRRGRAFGILGAGIGAGAAVGPLLGGLLVEAGGWRGIFVVSVPIAAAAVVLFSRLDAGHVRLDDAEAAGFSSVLHKGPFLAACAVQATTNFSQYSVLLVIPLALDAMGWSSASVGAVLSGMTVGLLVLSPIGGTIGDRTNRRAPVMAGTAIGVVGTVLLAGLGLEVSAALVAGIAVLGVGMGVAAASLQTSALEAVDARSAGTAAGVLSTSRYVGSISSTVLIAAVVGDGLTGVRTVLAATVAGTVLATVASAFLVDARWSGQAAGSDLAASDAEAADAEPSGLEASDLEHGALDGGLDRHRTTRQ